jgi:DNA (cytosine-5)-methyltransferase 1
MNYYNEHDPKAAAWLKELINTGLIPNGDVDERSITEVSPRDLSAYTQCHFFAGIGGWSLALQLAGWPADRPVWTGSCPCQPFSTAGKGLGDKDERHLWPVFFDLIKECRPDAVFGEQVASAIGKGWLDGISTDLESENYICGATVLGAHSVGSPHIRQRLYWVADLQGTEQQRHRPIPSGEQSRPANSSRLVLANSDGCSKGSFATTPAGYGHTAESAGSRDDRLGNAEQPRLEGLSGTINERSEPGWIGQNKNGSTATAGFWTDYRLAKCRDGKARRIPTEPTFQPLAHGIPARVVRLRGYGNAIVPQVASEFIKAFNSVIF